MLKTKKQIQYSQASQAAKVQVLIHMFPPKYPLLFWSAFKIPAFLSLSLSLSLSIESWKSETPKSLLLLGSIRIRRAHQIFYHWSKLL